MYGFYEVRLLNKVRCTIFDVRHLEGFMAFDTKKFMKTKFTPRTGEVPVPDMKDFFPQGAEPVWKVRGLTGQELGRAAEAAARNRNISAIIEGLTGDADKEKAEALKNLLGIGVVPQDIAKRLEHLVIGSIDPVCTLDMAVRVCEVYPVEFYQITNKVMELTGRGQEPGKQQPSGKTEKSGPVSHSVTPEGDSSTK
jgi:hypothetical protein